MKLYIDGDALPNAIKEIIIRAINKKQIKTYVVANKKINVGKCDFIEYIIVNQGADEADNHIVELVQQNDLGLNAKNGCVKT
jgi:uncharacterized protein YaiI (UPF0178 family)